MKKTFPQIFKKLVYNNTITKTSTTDTFVLLFQDMSYFLFQKVKLSVAFLWILTRREDLTNNISI